MPLHRSSVKHLNVGGLIALSRHQKPSELFSALVLRRCALRRFKVLRPALSRESSREIAELLCLKCEDLVAGLGGLQGAAGTLARRYERRCLDAVGIEVADDTGLNSEGSLATRRLSFASAIERC